MNAMFAVLLQAEEIVVPIDLPGLIALLVSLPGFGALVSMLVNVLKTLGVVKDGTAVTWATGLNLVGAAALFYLVSSRPGFDPSEADAVLVSIAQIGGLLLGLFLQFRTSQATHEAVRGAYLVGKSYSYDEEVKEEEAAETASVGPEAAKDGSA